MNEFRIDCAKCVHHETCLMCEFCQRTSYSNFKVAEENKESGGGKVFCIECSYLTVGIVNHPRDGVINIFHCVHPTNVMDNWLGPKRWCKETPMILNWKNNCELFKQADISSVSKKISQLVAE